MLRLLLLPFSFLLVSPLHAQSTYQSPYSIEFTYPEEELIADLLRGPRADWRNHANVPHSQWYAAANRRRWGYWGPGMRHFPAPAGYNTRSPRWARERVIATGLRYVGYGYQHHHVPDWSPPADWPRAPGQTGPRGKGVDCSNFTGFIYNLALGLLPTTAIGQQAIMTEMAGPGPGRRTPVRRIELPAHYDDFPQTLQTADLLFIKNRQDNISHVVFWIGEIGRSPGGYTLVLDSTGPTHRDADGEIIPDGIQLRPFKPRSWYFSQASHAVRVLPDATP